MPYKSYLDKLEAQKNGDGMFDGILIVPDNAVVTIHDICNNNDDEVDLSWLYELA